MKKVLVAASLALLATPAFPLEPEQIREGVLWVGQHAAEYGGG